MPGDPHRVQAVFLAMVEKPASERPAYLDHECGDDQDLRHRVEALLLAHDEPGSFLDSPPTGLDFTLDQPITEQHGTQIGAYKLLQEIGEGGMGVVYLAEQTEPVKRRVALKLIKPGMDSRQIIARFEAERQALAMMDHPNIARALDCGTTDSGHPFFIMELVKGVPITRYCDDNHLTPRQRLELFVPICQAIQHAHQKGIIHRDIKPSNIMVAEYGQKPVPKIIDFGVAKALNQQLTDKTNFTGLGQVVGTIEYMSPEQAGVNQSDVDTRSDIYSLGVLLYELLTGVTPFDKKRLHAAAMDELLRIIREEEPPRPSTRLSTIDTLPSVAANRHIEPRKLGALLHGELDWIVMKALGKNRARRYETANGFANDVQRYLDDEAVVACPPSARYRFKKFARRNKVAIVTSSLIVTALVLGIMGTGWQAIRATRAESKAETRLVAETKARKEADEAHADAEISKQAALRLRDAAQTEATRANNVVKVLKSIFSSQDARDQTGVPKNYTVAQLFTDLADRLPAELSEEPAVEAEIRSIIGRAFVWNDSPLKAYPHFVEARRLREAIYPPDHPIHIESLLDLVDYYYHLGNYLKAYQIAGEILPRAQALDGHVELKLRAYAAWIQSNESLPWIQRNGDRQAVFELATEALDLATANNEINNPSTIQINRVSISHRFRELIQNADKPQDFEDELRAIEIEAEQALATCEGVFGKLHVSTVPFLRLAADIQAIQGRNEAAEDLLIRAYKTNAGLKIFGINILEELRILGLPESQIEELIEQTPEASNYSCQVEAINYLYNHDVAGYRSLTEKLLQRHAGGDSQALIAALFAAFVSEKATDDWAALRDLALSSIEPENNESGRETGIANMQAHQCFVWPLIGGILYRTNDLQQAVEILEESDHVLDGFESSSPGVASSYVEVYRWYDWLFLSMANHRLGNHQQSQEYFIRAATQIPRLLKNFEFGPGRLHEQTVSLLYQEAFETIEFDPDVWIVDESDDSELVARAELYLLDGQKPKALLDYSAAIEQNPKNALPRRLRAELLQGEGRFPEALADFSKAIELEPDRGELWQLRAYCLYASGRYEQAIDDWNRAFELNPIQFWARLERGNCHAELGHRDLALNDYLATRVDPPPRSFAIDRGWCLLQIEQFDEAVKDFSVNPNDAWTLILRGLAYCHLEQFEKAIADCSRAMELESSTSAGDYRGLVAEIVKSGKLGQLIAELTKAIESKPTNAWSYVIRAEINRLQGHMDEAIADFRKASELRPDSIAVHTAFGTFLRELGRYREAITEYDKAIELDLRLGKHTREGLGRDPRLNRGRLHSARGQLWFELKQYERALVDFDRVLEIGLQPYFYKRRALTHFRLEHFEAALADLGRAAAHSPEDVSTLVWIEPSLVAQCPDESFKTGLLDLAGRFIDTTDNKADALVNRARLLIALNQPEEAKADYKRAQAELYKNLKNSSNKAQSWFDYAYALHNAGMLDAAIDAHKKAAEFDQVKPVATYNLACAYSLKNEKDNAFDALDKAIEFGFRNVSLISTDSDLDNLRDDDRFEAIVAKIQWGTWYERGIAKANAGENEQAISALTKAIELGEENWQVHYHLALAQLGAADVPGYREACRGMSAALADTQDPLIANFVAWTCSLAPDALEDWSPALKLARMAAEAQSESLQNQNTLGTLLMRAGETDEAIKVLSAVAEQLDKPDASANFSPAYTWYALALALKQSGSKEQAREFLNKANATSEAVLSDELDPPAWNRRLTLQLLRKEAETAIGATETDLPDTNPKQEQEEIKSAGTR